MKPVRKVSIFYGHVASNIGDLAINVGQANLLREAFPGVRLHFVLLDSEKSEFLSLARASLDGNGEQELSYLTANYKDALRYQCRPAEFLRASGAEDADLIALASGEHLFRYAHGENEKSLFWRTLPALAAKACNKRCVILPSTFGPFEDDASKGLIAALLDIVDGYAVRDAASKRLLGALLGRGDINTFLDPAFFLPAPPKRQTRNSAQRRIGLAMRSEGWGIRLSAELKRKETSRLSSDNYQSSQALEFSVILCRHIIQKLKCDIQVFVQTTADETLAAHLQDALAEHGLASSLSVYRPASVEDYLSAIAGLDFMVASRFHAIVMAMVAGVPAVGIYFEVHGHKMPGLFELMDMQDHCINFSRFSAQSVAERTATLIRKSPDLTDLGCKIESLRSRTVSWLRGTKSKRLSSPQWLKSIGATSRLMQMYVDAGYLSASEKRVSTFKNSITTLSAEKSQFEKLATELGRKLAAMEGEIVRIHGLDKQLSKRDREIGYLNAKLATVRAAMSRAEETEQHLRQELEAERQRSASARKVSGARERALLQEKEVEKARLQQVRAAARNTARQSQEYERNLEQVRNSVAFRLGALLVRATRSPKKILRLPLDVGALYATYRKERLGNDANPAGNVQTAKRCVKSKVGSGRELSWVVQAYENEGVAGVAETVTGAQPSDRRKQCDFLIEAAKYLVAEGYPEAELNLVKQAVKIHESDTSLRALYWVAQRTGEIETGFECIRKIRLLNQVNPNEAQRKFLAHVSRGPINQLTVLDFLPEKAEMDLVSIPGRICYILHNSLPYSSGGYATRAQGLATGLNKAGYEMILVTRPGFPVDTISDLADKDIPLEEDVDGIAYRRDLTTSRTGRTAVDYVRTAADALTVQFEVLRPQVVIGASNYLTAFPGLIAARRLGLPFLYEVRGFWEITRISREPEYKQTANFKVQSRLEAETAMRSDHVFTLTGPMKQELSARGVNPNTITILPNSCEVERFTPRARDPELAARLGIPENVPVIGYIGTFVQYEGLERLVEAAARLRDRDHVFRLLLVGNENTSGSDVGPITAEINRIASAHRLDQWLILPGRVPHEEVEAYYSLIDIAPFPRKSQPVSEMVSPMKPLEAFAMEKAVVVSSVAALEEMVEHERTGLIFDKDSVESLTDALARLIVDPGLRERLGQEGRRWVENRRTWDATARRAAKVISTITGRGQEENRVA